MGALDSHSVKQSLHTLVVLDQAMQSVVALVCNAVSMTWACHSVRVQQKLKLPCTQMCHMASSHCTMRNCGVVLHVAQQRALRTRIASLGLMMGLSKFH